MGFSVEVPPAAAAIRRSGLFFSVLLQYFQAEGSIRP